MKARMTWAVETATQEAEMQATQMIAHADKNKNKEIIVSTSPYIPFFEMVAKYLIALQFPQRHRLIMAYFWSEIDGRRCVTCYTVVPSGQSKWVECGGKHCAVVISCGQSWCYLNNCTCIKCDEGFCSECSATCEVCSVRICYRCEKKYQCEYCLSDREKIRCVWHAEQRYPYKDREDDTIALLCGRCWKASNSVDKLVEECMGCKSDEKVGWCSENGCNLPYCKHTAWNETRCLHCRSSNKRMKIENNK